MSCPDWNELIIHRDRDAAGEREWLAALAHLDGCGDCHDAALAAEPTLLFRRLPSAVLADGEAHDMRQAVAALRRRQDREPIAGRGRRWTARRAAAQAAVVIGAALLARLVFVEMRPPESVPAAADTPSAVLMVDSSDIPAPVGELLEFDIQVLRATSENAGNKLAALPPEVAEKLAVLRYDGYDVLAQASGTTRGGEDVTYALGGRFEVSFKLDNARLDEPLQLEGLRVTRRLADKSRNMPPRELFHGTVRLAVAQPLTLLLDDPGLDAPLVIAITCRTAKLAPEGDDR